MNLFCPVCFLPTEFWTHGSLVVLMFSLKEISMHLFKHVQGRFPFFLFSVYSSVGNMKLSAAVKLSSQMHCTSGVCWSKS